MRNKTWFALIMLGLLLVTIIPFVDDVKADPPSPHPYDYFYAPSGNGFGHNYVKFVNITFFKNMFQDHTKWRLEYKQYSYSSWTDGNSYLSIQKTWNGSGFWKFVLTLNVPVNIYSARFTFGIDINCLQYVERSGTEIRVNYTANATETFSCMFNWSDIASISNLIITKGITDNKMWFRFQKDNILSGNYVFDPTFGISSIGITSASTENVVVSSSNYRSYVMQDGIPRSISVYLAVTTASHKVKCGLYYSNTTFFAFTEEKIIPVGTGWNTFNFLIGTYILLKTQDYYFISVWSNATLGDCRSYGTWVDESVTYRDSENYVTNFPDPIDTSISGTYTLSAYCTYTYLYPLSVKSMYPVNNSYTCKNVTVSFIVNHTGGSYNVLFYKKVGSNPYFLVFTKNNVLNDTYYSRFFNATALNVLYSWKVCLKNASVPYWKNTTYQFYIKFSNNTLITVNNNINVTGSSSYIWDNSIGFTVTNAFTGIKTPFTYHNNTVNVSSVKQLKLLSDGYHLWDNSSSGILSYINIVNASGTFQKAWYSALGKFKVWANYSGNGSSCPSCNSTNLTINEFLTNCTGGYTSYYNSSGGWFVNNTYTGNMSAPGNLTGNYTMSLNFTGFNGYIVWSGDHIENNTNISFPVTSNMSINGSVHVDEDAYFLSGMLSFDPAVMILSLFFGFFYIGYESKKRSGGFFMLFAGFLLIALGILVYGMLGYAAVLVVPFAIFIMLLGGKKAFYGPETEESQGDKPTK